MKAMDEGTAEPFIARLIVGILESRYVTERQPSLRQLRRIRPIPRFVDRRNLLRPGRPEGYRMNRP